MFSFPERSCSHQILAQSTCTARNAGAWATSGIAIAGITGSETTVALLTGAVTTSAGYTRQAQANANVPAAATCTGTADDGVTNCASAFAAAANTLAASCPAGCVHAADAAIECRLGSASVTEAFVVTPDATVSVDAGGSANKCVLPATAATGYDITGLTCGAATTSAGAAETTTGTINCAVPHTCVAATCVAVAGLAVRCRGSDGRPLLRTGTTRPLKVAPQATR